MKGYIMQWNDAYGRTRPILLDEENYTIWKNHYLFPEDELDAYIHSGAIALEDDEYFLDDTIVAGCYYDNRRVGRYLSMPCDELTYTGEITLTSAVEAPAYAAGASLFCA